MHRVLVHGCAYGLRSQASPGKFLRKAWAIETTDPAFQESVGKKCPGNHHHENEYNQDHRSRETRKDPSSVNDEFAGL